MLLLHVSDIHFRSPDCLNPAIDPDRPYRTRLSQDIRDRTRELGPVEAILISGDIAYKGAPEEYEAAMVWIRELAAVAGCSLASVFVVPGNHDINREIIMRTPAVRNTQSAISRSNVARREREFRAQISDAETGRSLLAPLAAYNDFAKLFNCQVFLPDRLYWKQDLDLQDGIILRLHGLTSTLLSGADGQDDTRESLYLSPLQTVLDPQDDVINLVLCHHPPDWFMDQDDAHDAFCGRAAIHMFGHKHRQRITREVDYVRFSAGAVNPDRGELSWSPGYNLVVLDIEGSGRDRKLRIKAHLRQWQTNPDMFRAIVTQAGDPVFEHTIQIPSQEPLILTKASPSAEIKVTLSDTVVPNCEAQMETAAMNDTSTRNLVYRFWNLSTSQRRDITLRLNLITGDELLIPEPERYGRALIRAGERGLLDELAKEIAKKEIH